jgi:diguanylate cyclase (GGDEF)-like protein/PAS domain S-box-containing protein
MRGVLRPQTTTLDSTIAVLRREIADLRGRLATSEAVLDAIRSGEADAIAVETPTGLRVFTLEGAEQPYRIMVEAMSEGAVTATRDGVILYCNPRFAEMVNAGLETTLGSSLPVHFAGDDARKIVTAIRESKTETKRASATLLARGGTSVPVNIAVRGQTDGGTESVAIVITDLTERERWEQAREKANRATRMSTIFHSVNDGIFLIDPDTSEIIEVNQSGCGMYGYTPEELVGHSVEIFESGQPPYGSPSTIDMFAKARKDGPQSLERRSRRKDGSLFWVEISLRVVPLAANLAALAMVRDITERKLAHEQIVHMARYDALTGLANRGVFVEALDQAIAWARRSSRGFAVLYLDLDHFKDVNDTLGHPVGDLLLQAVAGRLRASVRRVDTVARFGGDEFAVIITDIEEPTDAAVGIERIQAAISEPIALQGIPAVASGAVEKILSAFNDPYVIQGNQIQSGTTVGIAVYASEPDAETLLAHADVALYRAKSERRGTYRFFSDAMDAEVRERVAMKTELREAIASNQFFLMYQPQVDIETGRIVGLEALVRWNHPTRGLLEPGWFIPAAEQSGLIVPLGHWVLAEACRQTKEWLDAGVAPSLIAVNMSGLQFRAPRELERDIVAVITARACRRNTLNWS